MRAQELVLAGAVGAIALGALLVFLVRRRDPVAPWLAAFLACVSLHLMLGREDGLARSSAMLALPFLALFVSALHAGEGRRNAAYTVVLLGTAALMTPPPMDREAFAFAQWLGLGVAAWATVEAVLLLRRGRSPLALLIPALAFGYPFLVLGFMGVDERLSFAFAPAAFVAFVLAPSIVLARRAMRAFSADDLRLSNQEKLTNDVLDSVPVALAMRDLEGRYLFVNRAWEGYFGLKREQVIGTTPRARASQADADALLALDRAALDKGLGAPVELEDFAHGGKRYMQTRTVMADSQGKVLGVLVASLDNTERSAMQQALATEQRRLALVVRAAQVGIIDWDGTSRTVYYSPRFREILRHAPDADTSGWPDYFELIHPDDRGRVQARFREHILGKGAEGAQELHESTEYRLRCADGSHVWVLAAGVSVRDAKGYATRFIGSIIDNTERRGYQEALEQNVRLREEVERMSRHDLKTPLNSIIAVPRLLREGRIVSPEDEQLLSIIERAGYRLLNLVNLSLDLFRMERGTYQFRPQAVDLPEMARRVIADLESQAASKSVMVRMLRKPADGRSLLARGEDLLCYSMLANLLKNAIEASPEGGTVSVTIEAAEGMLIHVHNRGAVPEAVRGGFFDKYTTAGKSGGIGLGTYSARLMARVQEGSVEMRTSEDEGTTLTVRLAEVPEAASSEAVLAQPGAAAATGPRPKAPALPELDVLIVDDDEFNRLVLQRYLPSPPLRVVTAVNGRAALEAARRVPPDVVFLDLEMPVMSGYEAVASLRAEERAEGRKRAKVIAFSSNDDEATISRALAAGCDHYLAKPAPKEALWKYLGNDAHVVRIDADLRDTVPEYLAVQREALDSMLAALLGGDRESLRRDAHRLAGSFSLYGFAWAAAQCRSIERDARDAEAGSLAERVSGVRRHLESVKIAL